MLDSLRKTIVAELPEVFLDRLANIVPDDWYDQCLCSFGHKERFGLRVNSLCATIDEVLAELRSQNIPYQPVAWADDAFTISSSMRSQLMATRIYYDGKIYIQNLSSLYPVLALDPRPGEQVLDLAAAPGGKSLHIACLMQNVGRIAAVERVKSRFFRLKSNLLQQQATCVHTYLKDGGKVGRSCPERFDRVLVDAPCSSEARFSVDKPSSYAYWGEKKIREMVRKQRRLLYSGFQSLKVGGVIVYCTCSFSVEENEEIIDNLLKRFAAAVEIVSLEAPFENYQRGITHWNHKSFEPRIKRAVRILPDSCMDGFFICKMKKCFSTIDY